MKSDIIRALLQNSELDKISLILDTCAAKNEVVAAARKFTEWARIFDVAIRIPMPTGIAIEQLGGGIEKKLFPKPDENRTLSPLRSFYSDHIDQMYFSDPTQIKKWLAEAVIHISPNEEEKLRIINRAIRIFEQANPQIKALYTIADIYNVDDPCILMGWSLPSILKKYAPDVLWHFDKHTVDNVSHVLFNFNRGDRDIAASIEAIRNDEVLILVTRDNGVKANAINAKNSHQICVCSPEEFITIGETLGAITNAAMRHERVPQSMSASR